MSKGNSGLLSKFQAKVEFNSSGVIGNVKGFEVLKEVVVRVRIKNAQPDNVVRVSGRMVNDDKWEEIGILKGNVSDIFHIASYDYIMFESLIYSTTNVNELISSAYFQDGMFMVSAINEMNNKLNNKLHILNSNLCDIKNDIEVLKRQVELITDHEEYEVK